MAITSWMADYSLALVSSDHWGTLAAIYVEPFHRASQAMANRFSARLWGAGQLLRPDQPIGLT